MRKKRRYEIAQLLTQFQKDIVDRKPTFAQMCDEVRMMQFKIRPLQGDVSNLYIQSHKVVEAIWNLGKFDEFFRKERSNFSQGEQDIMLNYFEKLYARFQKELTGIAGVAVEHQHSDFGSTNVIEMEIFREYPRKKQFN
jgi:hypothetical protein